LGVLAAIDKVRIELTNSLDAERRSKLGQFMTPATVARFMASLFQDCENKTCHLLDPGAGMGALTAAFLERCEKGELHFKHVSTVAYEIDETLRSHLGKNLAKYAQKPFVSYAVESSDFIEAAVGSLTGDIFATPLPLITHAIMNPPYKKINSNSRHRVLLRRAGVETVNLYSAFVALALALLAPGGQLVAIIPRSFCNGPYYRPFREFLLSRAAIRRIHLFGSRDKAFKDDNVLQENVILHLEREVRQDEVIISTSTDDRFQDCTLRVHPFSGIVLPNDPERFIHVPESAEGTIQDLTPSFGCSLKDLGVQVSTGPVVDFRARAHICQLPGKDTVPLLYPCHFGSGLVDWPKPEGRKPNAILRNETTERLLYPSGCYAVVRRFSAKEERRRIVAGVICPSALRAEAFAFENHLNVFHENKGGLPETLAWGLTAFLNSTAVDTAFRRFNGHTQVNATDLRSMRYPDRKILTRLGRWAMAQKTLTQDAIDKKLETFS
jgi:adenine-specific DNA-methyltransferase